MRHTFLRGMLRGCFTTAHKQIQNHTPEIDFSLATGIHGDLCLRAAPTDTYMHAHSHPCSHTRTHARTGLHIGRPNGFYQTGSRMLHTLNNGCRLHSGTSLWTTNQVKVKHGRYHGRCGGINLPCIHPNKFSPPHLLPVKPRLPTFWNLPRLRH